MSFFGNQPQQGYPSQGYPQGYQEQPLCLPGCKKPGFLSSIFGSSQQQYPQGQVYGGKLSKKAKKGGSVKPFCPSVWSNQAPFPAAVGGKRKSKKMRKSSGTMKKTIPDISKIEQQQGIASASAIGGKMRPKSHKTLKAKKGTSSVSSLDVLRAANQASAAAMAIGGRKRKHKRSHKHK